MNIPKTTPQAKPGKIAEWRCGAPRGNRNAARPVCELERRVKAMAARLKALRRLARAERGGC